MRATRSAGASSGAGRRARSAVTAALPPGWDFDPREAAALAQAAATADLIDELQSELAEAGLDVRGAAGQRRAHPFLAEIRSQRLALTKMLAALGLPSGEEDDSTASVSAASDRGRAARARWGGRWRRRRRAC